VDLVDEAHHFEPQFLGMGFDNRMGPPSTHLLGLAYGREGAGSSI
jgi:hypothetical protein